LGLVGAESEGFCDCSGALGLRGDCGFVAYVYGEGVCVAVVCAFEFGDAEVFVSAFHRVLPSVLCLWSLCRSAFSLFLPWLRLATIQSFGVCSVFAAYTASASAQSWSSCVFGGCEKESLLFRV